MKLKSWKIGMFFWQLAQAIAVTMVSYQYASDFKIQWYVSTIDVSGQSASAEFLSEHEPLFSSPFKLWWIYSLVPITTALHYAGCLFFWETFETFIQRECNPWRWAEYSVSASLMTVALANLCAVTDVAAIVGLVAVNVAVQMFGYLSERVNANQPKAFRSLVKQKTTEKDLVPFILGGIVFSISWLGTLVLYFIYNVSNGDPPDFVYATIIVISILYLLFPLVHYLHAINKITYKRADIYYDVLSLTSKASLDWLIVGGLIGW